LIPETFKSFYIKCKNRLFRFYFTHDKLELIAESSCGSKQICFEGLPYNPWELPIDYCLFAAHMKAVNVCY
jgi:hypothetical protein